MVRILKRLAVLAVCATALSVPALARPHDDDDDRGWRRGRSHVVVTYGGDRDYGSRRVYYVTECRENWWGDRTCYDRPVVVAPRYRYYPRYYHHPRYYRPRTGVNFFLNIR